MIVMIIRGQSSWTIRLSNVQNVSWNFQGVDLEEQQANVEYLASSMRGGMENVANNINEILELAPDEQAQQVVQTLFSTTEGLQVNGATVFDTADGYLADMLEDVGEALATFLAGM